MAYVLRGIAAKSAGSTRLAAHASAQSARPVPAAAPATSPRPVVAPAEVSVKEAAPSTLAELEALRHRACAEGVEQGRREAKQQIDASLAQQRLAWQQAIETLQSRVEEKLTELEAFGVAVAFEACARVLGDAAVDRQGLQAVVQSLLSQTNETALLCIHLPPASLEAVQQALSADSHWRHRPLSFKANPALGPGECRIVSSHGQLESSLPIRLAAIQQSLLHTFEARQQSGRSAS